MADTSLKDDIQKDLKRYYRIPCYILIGLCFLVFLITGIKVFNDTQWTLGLVILIILGIVLAVLAIIAMVATYREISRLHIKEKQEFIDKVDDFLVKLQNIGITDTEQAKTIGDTLTHFLKKWDTLEEDMKRKGNEGAKEALGAINTKLAELEEKQTNVATEVEKATQKVDTLVGISKKIDQLAEELRKKGGASVDNASENTEGKAEEEVNNNPEPSADNASENTEGKTEERPAPSGDDASKTNPPANEEI